MSEKMNKELIINWILFHAVRYSEFKVIDAVMSLAENRIELELCEKFSDNQHAAYAYIYSAVRNINNPAVFNEIQVWSFCVELLDKLYPTFSHSFGFIVQLQNQMKFIVLLLKLKQKLKVDKILVTMNEYFPVRNKHSQLSLMERYQIRSYASRRLEAIFKEYHHYRFTIIYYLFHCSQFDDYYQQFTNKKLQKWSKDMGSKIKTLIKKQTYSRNSPLDDILSDRFTGVDYRCQNEVKYVKDCLVRSHSQDENVLTENNIIRLIRLVNNYNSNEEVVQELTEEFMEELEPSLIPDSQQLIAEMSTGGSKRVIEFSDDDLVGEKHLKYSTATLVNGNFLSRSLLSSCNQMKLTLRFNSNVTESNKDWPLQTLRLSTCSELYRYWSTIDVNKSKPLRGLEFDVSYLDTWPTAPKDAPIILSLHGVGDSHRVVVPLLPYLLKDKVRVIAPNFPGCGHTPMDPGRDFSHTDQEKATFVLDFLTALDITKVDLLLSHSAAIYPTTYILEATNLVKSLVLLMPGGLEPLTRYWKIMNAYLFITEFLRNFGKRKPLSSLEFLLLLYNPRLKLNMEQVDSTVKTLVFANHERAASVLERLSFSKFPILLMHSTDDHIVGPHMHTVLKALRISDDVMSKYNSENKLITSPPTAAAGCYGIVFETGKHDIHNYHSKVIGEAVNDLFRLFMQLGSNCTRNHNQYFRRGDLLSIDEDKNKTPKKENKSIMATSNNLPSGSGENKMSASGSATGNPRNKVALKPGRSLMDWIRLGHSGKDLTGQGGKIIKVTYHELKKHSTEDDAWIAVNGNVYCVTHYMEFHPGGICELMRGVGTDATKLFNETHQWVNYESMLQKCLVGRLVNNSLTKLLPIKYQSRIPHVSKDKLLNVPNNTLAIKVDVTDQSANKSQDNFDGYQKCILCAKYRVNHNTKIFKLKLPPEVRMEIPVGHHVQIRATIEDVEIIRNYTPVRSSLDNSEEEGESCIYLMIKIYEGGALTSYLDLVHLGEEIEMRYVKNCTFEIERLKNSKRIYLFAAGTGLTPMIRVLHESLNRFNVSLVKLIFFNRDEKDILWREEFDKLAKSDLRFHVVHVLSDANENWTGLIGRVNKDLVSVVMDDDLKKFEDDFSCVCGPNTFTDETFRILEEFHFPAKQVHLFKS
ncbi:Cytochrome b5 reductase 4 [Chamberlinius hualienensis]